MKILVTGASGFIGRNVLLALPKDVETTALYFKSSDFLDFLKQRSLPHVRPVQLDLTDSCAVKEKIGKQKFDVCVYLAANGDPVYSAKNPAGDLTANTLTLLHLLESTEIKRLMYFSSGAVYEGCIGPVHPETPIAPLLPYAVSNQASERYLQYAGKIGRVNQWLVVRFFGAYGPYEAGRKIYNRLIKQFYFSKNPTYTVRGNGQNRIDAMYVEDTVRAIQQMIENPDWNRVVDLYSGTSITIEELVLKVGNFFGIQPKITFTPDVIEYNQFYSEDVCMRDIFHFTPTISLEEGIERFKRFMEQYS